MTNLKTIDDIELKEVDTVRIIRNKLRKASIKRARYYEKQMSEAKTHNSFYYWKGKFDNEVFVYNLTTEDLK